jgi:uncharacterized membrane protein YbhN (UPF0104 family)
MSRTSWAWVRALCGVAILAVLVWRVGAGPFVDAVPMIDAWSLAAVVAISAVTTVCCAWRWSLIARGLGVGLPMPAAVAACYRSQFLNTILPGGVAGDVHRAWRHGRDAGDVSRAAQAVAWERIAGQVVQAALAVVVLLILPSPVRSSMPLVLAAAAALALCVLVLARPLSGVGPQLARRAWLGVVLASTVAIAGHAVTFLIAARVAGSDASPAQLLPLALLVLLAMGVPMNVAGWGPREGMAAWAFGAAGLGATLGVTTAVVYGVMSFVACLPGAGVLLVAWWLRRPAYRTEGTVHV